MTLLGERIRFLRKAKHLTQEELANRLGYKSRSSVNKIEKGINDLPQSQVVAFAKALDTTPSYLMGWVDSSKPQYHYPIESKELLIKKFESAPEDTQRAICLLLGIDYASLQR